VNNVTRIGLSRLLPAPARGHEVRWDGEVVGKAVGNKQVAMRALPAGGTKEHTIEAASAHNAPRVLTSDGMDGYVEIPAIADPAVNPH
jgi:hypothetical protein